MPSSTRQLGRRRGGQPVGSTEAEDDAVVAGQLVGGGTWQNERKSGCRGQWGGSERTATVLRSDHADATGLGEDRRDGSGGTGGVARIVTGDDPDGLGGCGDDPLDRVEQRSGDDRFLCRERRDDTDAQSGHAHQCGTPAVLTSVRDDLTA